MTPSAKRCLCAIMSMLLAGCVNTQPVRPATQPTAAVVTPALQAEKERYQVALSDDGRTVEFLGVVSFESVTKAIALMQGKPQLRTLRITSPGGQLRPGLALAAEVERLRLDVYVPLYCASACTVVLAAGRERGLAPGARLAFHSASAPLGDQEMANWLADHGVAPAFIAQIQTTPHEGVWYPAERELTKSGLVTDVVGDAARAGRGLVTDPLLLAEWGVLHDQLFVAFAAAFPEQMPPLRQAAMAMLREAAGAEQPQLGNFMDLMGAGLDTALPRASDAALRSLFQAMRDLMITIRDVAPEICLDPISADAILALAAPDLAKQHIEKLTVALAAVFTSYAEAPVAVDAAALSRRYQRFNEGLWERGVLRQSDMEIATNPARDPRRFCDMMVIILEQALRDERSAEVLRGMALLADTDAK